MNDCLLLFGFNFVFFINAVCYDGDGDGVGASALATVGSTLWKSTYNTHGGQ